MPDHIHLTITAATVALCAIVGIYYVWARKLGKSKADPAETPAPGAHR